ncbi:major facilitator superfamily domain-containing protein [Aspergillus germanicus]
MDVSLQPLPPTLSLQHGAMHVQSKRQFNLAVPLRGQAQGSLSKNAQRARPDNANPESPNSVAEHATNQVHLSSKTKWRLLSACLMNFGNGMNDSAPGALLPSIEVDYEIGYAIVSLIFIANAVGFLLAAPLNYTIKTELGHSKSYALSMGLITGGYIVIAAHPPFPVVVVAFLLLGFGMALSIAMNNVFCANLAYATTALGCFSGAYGIGGVVSPLIATAMASSKVRWSFFYVIPLALSIANLVFSAWAFADYEENIPVVSQQQRPLDSSTTTTTSTDTNNPSSSSRLSLLKTSLKIRTTLLGALFIFSYQGAEVSISGWVVSFLIAYRDGNASQVGYVSAGFWAGITLGRFLLVYPANRIGNKLAVALMVTGSIAFQLLTWLVPNIIAEAVAVGILGLLLGPIFPCSTAIFARLLPRKIQLVSLSFISALGSSGGAVFPFLTGLLAQSRGTMVLHPVCLCLYGVMLMGWIALPRIGKRSE